MKFGCKYKQSWSVSFTTAHVVEKTEGISMRRLFIFLCYNSQALMSTGLTQ